MHKNESSRSWIFLPRYVLIGASSLAFTDHFDSFKEGIGQKSNDENITKQNSAKRRAGSHKIKKEEETSARTFHQIEINEQPSTSLRAICYCLALKSM